MHTHVSALADTTACNNDRPAFEQPGRCRERHRRHETRPDDEREHVRLMLAGGALRDDIADGPRKRRYQHQQQADERRSRATS